MLALSAHYRFEPRPVAIARGNEKGRVERAIRYIRDNFFAGRSWDDIEDLNAQASDWCRLHSAARPCPENPNITVREAFEHEQTQLLSLPDSPFPTDDREEVSVGKTPYVRFDLNDYSVPHTYVQRVLTVMATLTTVRVLDGTEVIAEHVRSYDKGEQVEDETHITALLTSKSQARHHRGQDRLAHSAPSSQAFLVQAAQRGQRLSTTTSLLLEMLGHYGASELEIALAETLTHDVPHPNAVQQVLERRREQREQAPPVPVALSDHPKAQAIAVRPASLGVYDQLHSLTQKTPDTTPDTTSQENTDDLIP